MGECIQDNTPVTDNTAIECEEIVSSKCITHEDSLVSLGLTSGSSLYSILNKLSDKLTTLFLRGVRNQDFTNQTSLTVVHNKGYYPIIQFKTLNNSQWTVNHLSKNKFELTFTSAVTDTLIYT